MSRLAIFIDGGYVDALTRRPPIRVDYGIFTRAIMDVIAAKTAGKIDMFRTYYYDCLPYQSDPPTEDERLRFASKRKFFDAIKRLPRFQIREGRLARRGEDRSGKPIFLQKRTDLLLGLDFAGLSSKRVITHAALIAGDSDFVPAIQVAKEAGISVWLFYNPVSCARDLQDEADERYALRQEFMHRVRR